MKKTIEQTEALECLTQSTGANVVALTVADIPPEIFSPDASAWTALYTFLAERHGLNFENAHNDTYAGRDVMKMLLKRQRIALKNWNPRASKRELDQGLSWSNLNAGPKEGVDGRTLESGLLVVVRDRVSP